jgi:outer membrane protein OmpA-like peptidoglycan-associated protein
LNPWPSVADLFSVLTVAAFAALILVALGAVIIDDNRRIEMKATQRLADIFREEYAANVGQVTAGACADHTTEQCIDIRFRFDPDGDDLQTAGIEQVTQACRIYREAVSKVLQQMHDENIALETSNLVLVIEGHTDNTVPAGISGKQRFLYNWTLSSQRAASVLYQFSKCGISRETGYRITSVGLADTRQLCNSPTPDKACHEQNRRITMRIRVERDTPVSHLL